MPNDRESLFADDWFKKGKKDLERAKLRAQENDLEDAAFHLQQAIEKYRKGYLLSKGWALQKIHDLEFLLDEALKYNPGLERFRLLCQGATGYYLAERYPFPIAEPKPEAIMENLADAEALIEMLLEENI